MSEIRAEHLYLFSNKPCYRHLSGFNLLLGTD